MAMNFNELKEKMVNVTKGQMTKTDFTNWIYDNVEIQSYIPMIDKYTIIKLFALDFQYKYIEPLVNGEIISTDMLYCHYEVGQAMNLLMAYADIVVPIEERSPELYDLMYQSGLIDLIMVNAGNDYEDLKSKCDRVIGIDNLSMMNEFNRMFAQNTNVLEFNNFLQRFEDTMNNPQIQKSVESLINIEAINDPKLVELIQTMRDTAR